MIVTDKLKFILILQLASTTYCNAQLKPVFSAPNRSNASSAQNFVGGGGAGLLTSSDVDYPIEGTPYFSDDFVRGSIFIFRGTYPDRDMRYNIYADRLEFKVHDSLYVIAPDRIIRKVVMGDHTLIVDSYEVKGKLVSTFFLRLDSGKISLMAKKIITFKDRQIGKPIQGDIPARYVTMPDTYYVKLGIGSLIKIESVKKLIEGLPDHRQEMNEFAQREKTSANKPKELISFIQHYNSLP